MVVSEIATGYSALKSAYEIARGLKDINDRVALNAAVIDLQEKILSAQEAATDARQRLRDMQALIDSFNQWEEIVTRYTLKDFGGNTYAYELRAEVANGEPHHLLCPNCYQNKRRSILQYEDTYSGRRQFECQSCGKSVRLGAYEERSGS